MRLTRMAQELIDINDDVIARSGSNDIMNIYVFTQNWSSTALGFSGMGGQKITEATTYVIEPDFTHPIYVYFGGRFAYEIDEPNDKFREDLKRHRMASVAESGRYKK